MLAVVWLDEAITDLIDIVTLPQWPCARYSRSGGAS